MWAHVGLIFWAIIFFIVILVVVTGCLMRHMHISMGSFKDEFLGEYSSTRTCTKGANLDNDYNTTPNETDLGLKDKLTMLKKYETEKVN